MSNLVTGHEVINTISRRWNNAEDFNCRRYYGDFAYRHAIHSGAHVEVLFKVE